MKGGDKIWWLNQGKRHSLEQSDLNVAATQLGLDGTSEQVEVSSSPLHKVMSEDFNPVRRMNEKAVRALERHQTNETLLKFAEEHQLTPKDDGGDRISPKRSIQISSSTGEIDNLWDALSAKRTTVA